MPEEDDVTFKVDEAAWERFHNEDVNDPANKWKHSYHYPEKDGITLTLWNKPLPELNGKVINKTTAVFKNIKLEGYMALIKSYEQKSKDNKQIKEFKIVSRTAPLFSEDVTESIVFMRQKVPLCSDRENLLRSKSVFTGDKKTLMFIQNTTEHPDYPVQKGCVRMKIYKAVKIM